MKFKFEFKWIGIMKPVSSHRPLADMARDRLPPHLLAAAEERLARRLKEPETFSYPVWASLRFTTNYVTATTFSWQGWFRFSWNSEHLAERFGEAYEAPHGTAYQYNGWLGEHHSV